MIVNGDFLLDELVFLDDASSDDRFRILWDLLIEDGT